MKILISFVSKRVEEKSSADLQSRATQAGFNSIATVKGHWNEWMFYSGGRSFRVCEPSVPGLVSAGERCK